MKDLLFIGGAIALIGGFGMVSLAVESHAEKQELRSQIKQLETEVRDNRNQLIGCYAN